MKGKPHIITGRVEAPDREEGLRCIQAVVDAYLGDNTHPIDWYDREISAHPVFITTVGHGAQLSYFDIDFAIDVTGPGE